MNYVPVVAWGLCPDGTNTERANYFGSWGLGWGLSYDTTTTVCRIPSHPSIPTIASFASGCIYAIFWILIYRTLDIFK
jgi:hypothetical protein